MLRGSAQGLDSAPPWLKHGAEGLCASGRPPSVSLYLCHGALAMLSWRGALAGPQWEQLLLLVPNTLLDLDIRLVRAASPPSAPDVQTALKFEGLTFALSSL